MPIASPLTTVTPAAARCAAISRAIGEAVRRCAARPDHRDPGCGERVRGGAFAEQHGRSTRDVVADRVVVVAGDPHVRAALREPARDSVRIRVPRPRGRDRLGLGTVPADRARAGARTQPRVSAASGEPLCSSRRRSRAGVMCGSDASVAAAILSVVELRSAHWKSSRREAASSTSAVVTAAWSFRSAIVRATRRTRAAPRPLRRRPRQMPAPERGDVRRDREQRFDRAAGDVAVALPRCRLRAGAPAARPRRSRARESPTTVGPVVRPGPTGAPPCARRSDRAAAPRAGGSSAPAGLPNSGSRDRAARRDTGCSTRSGGSSPGNSIVPEARLMRTTRSSSGWRSASSTAGGNSASSSRNRAPRCASVISPGRARPLPPPTSAATDALWCGARNGRAGQSPLG